jgi:hypothetical protein
MYVCLSEFAYVLYELTFNPPLHFALIHGPLPRSALYLQVYPPLCAALEECKSVFGGAVALYSNSAGLFQFDPEGGLLPLPSLSLSLPHVNGPLDP